MKYLRLKNIWKKLVTDRMRAKNKIPCVLEVEYKNTIIEDDSNINKINENFVYRWNKPEYQKFLNKS